MMLTKIKKQINKPIRLYTPWHSYGSLKPARSNLRVQPGVTDPNKNELNCDKYFQFWMVTLNKHCTHTKLI